MNSFKNIVGDKANPNLQGMTQRELIEHVQKLSYRLKEL